MKRILKIGTILLSTFSALSVAGGNSGFRSIDLLQQRECTTNKGFTITLASAHENPDSCADNIRLEVPCDSPGFDQIVSISLTALAADKEVQAYVSGCDGENQAKVVALTIKK
jgi:hypothetical protein